MKRWDDDNKKRKELKMNPMIDSREGYSEVDWEEYESYLDGLDNQDDVWYDEDDGQPSEYTEWQDLPWGGDDWDHGQFDEF